MLYPAKAELFRTLAHPVRIRVLELLAARATTQSTSCSAQIDAEQSNLSQHLAVLRRAGLVRQTRVGGEVVYSLVVPAVRDLLVAGRAVLRDRIQEEVVLGEELTRDAAWPSRRPATRPGTGRCRREPAAAGRPDPAHRTGRRARAAGTPPRSRRGLRAAGGAGGQRPGAARGRGLVQRVRDRGGRRLRTGVRRGALRRPARRLAAARRRRARDRRGDPQHGRAAAAHRRGHPATPRGPRRRRLRGGLRHVPRRVRRRRAPPRTWSTWT